MAELSAQRGAPARTVAGAVQVTQAGRAVQSARAGLVVDDLRIRRGGHDVVHGASFHLEPGASLGIVGESGCGKSTILKVLVGIEPDWTGSMSADGHPLTNRRTLAQRRMMQIVFQDPLAALNPAHTVDEILREPLIIHGFDRHGPRVQEAIARVALPAAVRYRFPGQLSGGQRQRVCIARALLVEPRILLLDEPTSALDVSVQAEVLNLLSSLRHELGQSFVLVSHDLAVVAHLCDRIAVMARGRFLEVLTREQLVAGRVRSEEAAALLAAARRSVPSCGPDGSGDACRTGRTFFDAKTMEASSR